MKIDVNADKGWPTVHNNQAVTHVDALPTEAQIKRIEKELKRLNRKQTSDLIKHLSKIND